jgi:uncharacterized protein YyaL (SSP411 family)
MASGHPRFAAWGLAVAEAVLDGPREVAVVGPAGDPATAALHRVALGATAPGAVVALNAVGTGDEPGLQTEDSETVPLLRDRPMIDGRSTAYVCRHFTCQAPTTDAAALARELGSGG